MMLSTSGIFVPESYVVAPFVVIVSVINYVYKLNFIEKVKVLLYDCDADCKRISNGLATGKLNPAVS